MPINKNSQAWIQRYAQSHRHPLNRLCHTIGIPLVAAAIPLFVIALVVHDSWPRFWLVPLWMFTAGWVFQFVGHGFEGKPPEFFRDWRFLFVGLWWWLAKVRGQV